MWLYNLKITFRNLFKNKLFSITNIAGLGIGIACCMLILLFVGYELSYEKWNPKADRIVRTYLDMNFGGTTMTIAVAGAVIAPDTKASLAEVENWCRMRRYGDYLVKVQGSDAQNINEDKILTVDSSFFELFPVRLLSGKKENALTLPQTMAISASTAKKYFGKIENAYDKVMILDNDESWQIKGVFEDIPKNTHFKADFLLSMSGNREVAESPPLWASNNNFHTYILLAENTDQEVFEKNFENLSRKNIGITSAQLLNMTLEEFEATGQYVHYNLQKLTDIHLHSSLQAELDANGDYKYIIIFSLIALFILLIACINFMNLTTAKSGQRSKEIGMRKILGSNRKRLVSQFFGETFVMTFLAVMLAIGLSSIAMPWFQQLTLRDIQIPWSSPSFWTTILLGLVLVSILAGSYPALMLSAFSPIQSIQPNHSKYGKHGKLRSALVVFQFTVAIALIIGTLLINNQIQFMQSKKLGFNREQVLIVNDAFVLGSNLDAFKNKILQNPAIEMATISSYFPTPSSRSNNTFTTSRELRQDNAINMQAWKVDHDYLSTIGMKMKEGRFFDKSFLTDSTAIILNESAAGILGYTDPIGKKIFGMDLNESGGNPTPEDFVEYRVIGVVKDFHYESLRENIGPLSMFLSGSRGRIATRFQAESSANVIAYIEKTWKEMAPSQPFSYDFMDDSFTQMYESEQRIGSIVTIFSILAILISCLGLFGLASFITEQRTKEIGIRKVLGASISGIVRLLSKDFMKLVFISLIIAVPLSWYVMSNWLKDFAYRTNFGWQIFMIAGVLALAIAFLTISLQSLKAATNNPVKSIQSNN